MHTRGRSLGPILTGVLLLLVLGGIVAWVILRSSSEQSAVGPPLNAPVDLAKLKRAPDFPITMYQGMQVVGAKQLTLARLLGAGRPVVLNFWAGLCPPCRGEMPDFQTLYAEYAKGKWTMIGVDIGPFVGLGSREDGQALLRELKITYPAGTTFDENTLTTYHILGMPTTIFITSDGKILRTVAGMLTRPQMTAYLNELLQVSGGR